MRRFVQGGTCLEAMRGNQPSRPRKEIKFRVAAALTARTTEVATALLGEANRQLSSERELRFGRKGSLAVVTRGKKAGWWYDHENGVGGDLINLIEHVQGVSFREAVIFAEGIIGSVPARQSLARTTCAPSADDESTRHRHRAGELWREAVPIADTVAQRYLARRGIVGLSAGVDGAVLRFHPACPFGDQRVLCMLAIMRDIHTDEPRAVYRTALTPTAEKIGRMALGPKNGAAVTLSPDEDVGRKAWRLARVSKLFLAECSLASVLHGHLAMLRLWKTFRSSPASRP